MKKAIIIGPYLLHNFGDDLIGMIISKYLQNISYSVTIPGLSKENSVWIGNEFSGSRRVAIKDADLIVLGGGGVPKVCVVRYPNHTR